MRSGIHSPPICLRQAPTSGRSRSCSATPICRRRRSIPALTIGILSHNIARPGCFGHNPAKSLSGSSTMGRPLDPFTGDSALPTKTGVVVIGGGIIGVATALELAERGVPVVLAEKGEIGAEQSSRNWGWCRQMGRDSREVPLAMESLRLWRRMNERVGAETGYRQSGVIYLAETEQGMAEYSRW